MITFIDWTIRVYLFFLPLMPVLYYFALQFVDMAASMMSGDND